MPTDVNQQKKRLRKYLNPAIKGEGVDAMLEALAHGPTHLVNNVEAVNDSLYIVSAVGKYLDARLADRDLTRPELVGLSDEVFRRIGIEVSNRKQVRDLMSQILEIIYGEEFTRATSSSTRFEPFQLQDGDTLFIQFDESEILEIPFKSSQFTNINQATAQEIADAISRTLSSLGKNGAAIAKDDGAGSYVMLLSGALGSSSSVRVLGGRAQNVLQFPEARPTAAQASTQWDISYNGQLIRMTWTGGAEPFLGKVKKGDYVNVFGSGFNPLNKGTFTVEFSKGGLVGESYFEFSNPNGIPEVAVQGQDDGVLFFNPKKQTIISKNIYAAVYQTESRLIEVFVPATTRVVRRDRKGAAHLYESGPSTDGQFGPYIYDEAKPYSVGDKDCFLTSDIESNNYILSVDDSSQFTDGQSSLVFGFGTSKEEGPVPCIGRPSSGTLRINPSYKFKRRHEAGTMVTEIVQNYAYNVSSNAEDFPFYITDMVSGRLYSEELIKLVAATGIRLMITVLYPNPVGLEHWNREEEEAKEWIKVWSE
jgi:hypothetical protein